MLCILTTAGKDMLTGFFAPAQYHALRYSALRGIIWLHCIERGFTYETNSY